MSAVRRVARRWGPAFCYCLAVSFGGAACRTPPIEQHDVSGLPSPEEALRLVLDEAAHRKSMRSLGRVTYFGEEGRVRLKAVLVVERPGRFRVETLSPLEQPIDVMVSDGERISLLSGGTLKEGPATPENVARLIPVALWPRELVDVMLGGVPSGDRYQPTELRWSEDRERWQLTLEGHDQKRIDLVIDPAHRSVESAEIRHPDGTIDVALRFEKKKPVEPIPGEFPRRIVFVMPSRDLEVTIKLGDVELNVDIAPTLFSIEPPAGVVPERMDSPPIRVGSSTVAKPENPE